jgi:hypothetical protein
LGDGLERGRSSTASTVIGLTEEGTLVTLEDRIQVLFTLALVVNLVDHSLVHGHRL